MAMHKRRSGRIGQALVATAALSGGLWGGLGSSAGAAPTNAPSSLTGQFFNCSNGDSGTFTVNSGNSHAAQTWNVAHLVFASGGTGIFVPTALALSFNGSPPTLVTKGSTTGSVTCSISATEDGFMLNGTVTGNVVTNG
jgi:hypothetical protein